MADKVAECVVCDRSSARDGYTICDSCEGRLADTLTEVVERHQRLSQPAWLLPASGGDGGRAGPGFASRSPARDRALCLLDPRTRATRPGDPRSVFAVLRTWTTLVRTQNSLPWAEAPTVDGEAALVGTWWDWVCRQPWVGEMVGDLRLVLRQLREETGEPSAKPVGYCMTVHSDGDEVRECGWPLYAPVVGTAVHCRACGRVYDGLDLVRLELSQTGS